jgi:very-long-chain enoyl-CoA reductase
MELLIANEKKQNKEEGRVIIANLNDKVGDLKSMVKNSLGLSLSTERIALYYNIQSSNEKVFLNNNEKKLVDYGVLDKTKIYYKDLGPQIGWRTVYIIEYLGPLVLISYFFFSMGPSKTNTTQKMAFFMSTFHYLKRIFESLFVHQFSRSTMPLKNLLTNCFYYWILYGLICGYTLFNENYVEDSPRSLFRYLMAFLFFSAEIKNLKCHLILKKLKENNKGEKGIPHGEGFEYVSSANYFWEFIAWGCFSIFVNLLSFYVFTWCGFWIMMQWAKKKHADYLKTFADRYPKNRKAFIPFLI